MGADPDPANPGPSEVGGRRSGPTVAGIDETGEGFDQLADLVEVARTTLLGEGVMAGHLDLVAVDPDDIARLNETHLGHEGPTDVLSFPLDADQLDRAVASVGPGDGPPLHLGDVILCPAVARSQAPDHCGTEDAELSLLVIHGVLHVLGHDHAELGERQRMVARERHHLAALGHPHPGSQGAAS